MSLKFFPFRIVEWFIYGTITAFHTRMAAGDRFKGNRVKRSMHRYDVEMKT